MIKVLSLTTVVVTYNRKKLLYENLKMQFCQTYQPNHIVIIDNDSKDGTYEFLKSKGIIDMDNVLYFNTGENIGGAGGFNYGIHKAYEIGDDLICLMDDDGRPMDNQCFQKVVDIIPFTSSNDALPIFVNSLVIENDDDITFPFDGKISKVKDALEKSQDGFLFGFGSPFNGTFINKKLIDIIGFPRADFFIRFDEYDYYLRAKRIKAYLGVAVYSKYYHPSTADYQKKRFMGFTFVNSYEAPWKEYYKTRNLVVLNKDLGRPKIKLFFRNQLYLFGTHLFRIKNRKNLKKFIRKGYRDAMNNRMGKVVEPGQAKLK